MTEKQQAARERNWNIKRLRGCWATVNSLPLNERNKQVILDGIDEILKELNAETEATKRKRQLAEKYVGKISKR